MMFKKILVASAATLVAATAITTSASANTSREQAPKQKPAAETKYCLQYEDGVGSRISRRECKTKAEWARQGVDVGNPSKN